MCEYPFVNHMHWNENFAQKNSNIYFYSIQNTYKNAKFKNLKIHFDK